MLLQYSLRRHLLRPILGHPACLHFVPPRCQYPIMLHQSFGRSAGVAVDGRVKGATQSFACALLYTVVSFLCFNHRQCDEEECDAEKKEWKVAERERT